MSSLGACSDRPGSFSRYQRYKTSLCSTSYEKPAAGCVHPRGSYQQWVGVASLHAMHVVSSLSSNRNSWADSRSSTPSRGYGGGGRGGYGNDRNFSGGFSRGGGGGGGGGWSNRRDESGWHSGGGGGGRTEFGVGAWRDGTHVPGQRNVRLEKELYGDPDDPSKQHTGINFEKYDDIPVEATGAGVPEPVTAFTNPPLDPVLLENISYARYTTPTPVQKYSIPIVALGRDLMACAQVSLLGFLDMFRPLIVSRRRVLARPAVSYSQFYRHTLLMAPGLPPLTLRAAGTVARAKHTLLPLFSPPPASWSVKSTRKPASFATAPGFAQQWCTVVPTSTSSSAKSSVAVISSALPRVVSSI